MVAALTADDEERESDFAEIMNDLSTLEQDDFSSNRHPALSFCLSTIFSKKPVPTFPDHALITGGGMSISLFHVAVRNPRVHEFLPESLVSQARIELQRVRLSVQVKIVDVS